MNDEKKTKKQLIDELKKLREGNARLQRIEKKQKIFEDQWKRYEFIVNTSKEFLSLIDTNYRYIAVNDSYCEAHNMSREEIIGKTVPDIWGDKIFSTVIRDHLDQCFRGMVVHYEARFKFPALGLKTVGVDYYPYRDIEGGVSHVVVVSRDITGQKRSEEELFGLKKAVETMQLGVTISDVKGKILFTNKAEAQMHGYSVGELLSSDARVFGTKDRWKSRTIQNLNEIRSWKREGINVRKDGSSFPVQLLSDVVKNSTGDPIAIVTTCEDITERKKIEEQIRRNLQYLTTLREIDMVILSSLDLRVILNELLNHLQAQLSVKGALVMILNPHNLNLEYAGSRGVNLPDMWATKLTLGEGLAGQVALDCRPISIPNLMERKYDALRPDFAEREMLTSYYGVPLVAKGQVKGTLEIFHDSHFSHDSEWQEFLEALANQAAIAIDNATLFQELQSSNTELALAYDTTLNGWSRALDLRDKETEGHSQRVTEITEKIARAMSVHESDVRHFRWGALLHDIGKMGIPDNILLKAGPLNEEEWEIMKRHPKLAHDLLFPIQFLRSAIDIPHCHHEKWDGTGYPRGLKGDDIPFSARIFTVADVWDALRSDRPYREAYPREVAVRFLMEGEGSHFDPEILKVFFKLVEEPGF